MQDQRQDAVAIPVAGDQELAAEAAERIDERGEGEQTQQPRLVGVALAAENLDREVGVEEEKERRRHLDREQHLGRQTVGQELLLRPVAELHQRRIERASDRLLQDARGEERPDVGEHVAADDGVRKAAAEDECVGVGHREGEQPDTPQRNAGGEHREVSPGSKCSTIVGRARCQRSAA